MKIKKFTEFAETSTLITGIVRDEEYRQIWADENIDEVAEAFSKQFRPTLPSLSDEDVKAEAKKQSV